MRFQKYHKQMQKMEKILHRLEINKQSKKCIDYIQIEVIKKDCSNNCSSSRGDSAVKRQNIAARHGNMQTRTACFPSN